MRRTVEVKTLPGYRPFVRYADGVAGEVDLSHLVGEGIFAAWNDPLFFAQASIGSGGEIRWSDQIDLCPDSIYMRITGKRPDEVFPSLAAS